MVELEVVLRELHLPCCGTRADFVGLSPIGEVFVIGPDDNREDHSMKQVGPVTEGSYDCK